VRYVAQRLLALIPTVILATLVVFLMLKLIPGDPATVIAGEYATEETLAEIREDLRLNDPLPEQYAKWAADAVRGDLGDSLTSRQAVSDAITSRLPATLHIVVAALLLSLIIGVPLGFIAGWKADSKIDAAVRGFSTIGIGAPNFWIGMMLVTFFSLRLEWFPAIGYRGLSSGPWEATRYLLLPAIALGAASIAEMARQTRSAVLDVRNLDFVRTLRSVGLPERTVLRHVSKNAGLTIITVLGLQASRLLGATVIVEAVFGIPGLGSLVVEAVGKRDYPVVQGVVLVMALLVLLVNLVVDLSYRFLDPRIRR
jgi:peptide/nickel transport system permease protein